MLFYSFCLRIQSHWEFLYLPVFVGITLLEHRASFSNIKQFEENQPRPQGFSLKKWVGREKALASAGHVSPRTP